MSGPAVSFVYADWIAEFPVFTAVSQPLAQSYFNRASNLFANDTCNPAFGAGILQQCLYLATAHVAQLNAPRDANGNPASTGQPASPLVGSITSAAEGSVNVAVEWKGGGTSMESYWTQTTFGAELWAATSQFRTMLYRPQPTRVGGFPLYIGARGGW